MKMFDDVAARSGLSLAQSTVWREVFLRYNRELVQRLAEELSHVPYRAGPQGQLVGGHIWAAAFENAQQILLQTLEKESENEPGPTSAAST
jgi:hypothetical protein